MPVIGILLPGSTLYPSIGVDFLQGIRACFSFHQATDLNLYNLPIQYGLQDQDIYTQSEKLVFTNQADVVIMYADHRVAQLLSPLFAAAGKLLIITNAGANYPPQANPVTHTLFHSLNHGLYAYMTGQLGSRLPGGNHAIMATSYYDGGYQHSHAMHHAFTAAGGEIAFHFVSHYKKEAFNISPLTGFIQNNPSINKLLCLYSGDMARCFYKQVAPLQQEYNLQLFGSPMLFDSTPGDFEETKPFVRQIKGYTGWVPALNNEHNRSFIEYFQKEHGAVPNLFSLQGWETGLLALNWLQQQPLQSPRGMLRVNNSHVVTGPAYFVTATGALDITVEEEIADTTTAWQEMINSIPATPFSGWRNTYLCI